MTDGSAQTDTDTALITITAPLSVVHDVGIKRFHVPRYARISTTKTVTVVVYNYGTQTEVVDVRLDATGALTYSQTISGVTVEPGNGATRVKFENILFPTAGSVNWEATVSLGSDENLANNTATGTTEGR